MPPPFDPLAWLRSKGCVVSLADDQVQILFNEYMHRPEREHIKRVIARHYEALLRLQLDVPPGTRPRTVQRLIAAGKVRIVGGRCRVMKC
jgi:hypothetical protein